MGAQVSSLPERQELIDELQSLAAKHLELSTALQKDDLTAACAKVNSITNSAKAKVLASYEKKKKVIEREILDMKEGLGSDDEAVGDYNLLLAIETSRDHYLELLSEHNAKKLCSYIQAFCDRKRTMLFSISDLGSELRSVLLKISGEVGAGTLQHYPPLQICDESTKLEYKNESFANITAELKQLKGTYELAEKERQKALDLLRINAILLGEANTKIESLTQESEIANTKIDCLEAGLGKTQMEVRKLSYKSEKPKQDEPAIIITKEMPTQVVDPIEALVVERKKVAELEQKLEALSHVKTSLNSQTMALEAKQGEVKMLVVQNEKRQQVNMKLAQQLTKEKSEHETAKSDLATVKTLINKLETLQEEVILLGKELEKEKNDHGKTQTELAELRKKWGIMQPLLIIGKNARNGFLEMVDRHFENGRLVPLHGGDPQKELIDLRNISVHEGDVLADEALYLMGYRSTPDMSRLVRIYGTNGGGTALKCNAWVKLLNMHGTMYKCKAWTSYSHDKRGEKAFVLMMTECKAIWNTAMKSKPTNVMETHEAFGKTPKVLSNIAAMERIKKSFVEKERERQRGSQ